MPSYSRTLTSALKKYILFSENRFSITIHVLVYKIQNSLDNYYSAIFIKLCFLISLARALSILLIFLKN